MSVTVIVGGFFGDEGKGKIVSYLTEHLEAAIVARSGVGPNAGHTVVIDEEVYKLRMIPSGFSSPTTKLLIGAGVLVNPEVFLREISLLGVKDRTFIDWNAGIIEPEHITTDTKDSFLTKVVETSGAGTGPANEMRVRRQLKQVKDIPDLSSYGCDVPLEIHQSLQEGNAVVVESSQATYLSLYHGTYPYVTSKDTTASSACADVGIGPTLVNDVVVTFKAFVTRVGKGPLENEISKEEAKKKGWQEFGTVTGRPRRAAPFNDLMAKRAVMLNGATYCTINKIDVLFPETAGVTEWEDLPENAMNWIEEREKKIGCPVRLIGTGPEAHEIIDRAKNK